MSPTLHSVYVSALSSPDHRRALRNLPE